MCMYINAYVCMHVCMYVCVCVYVCMYIYIYVRVEIHMLGTEYLQFFKPLLWFRSPLYCESVYVYIYMYNI